ncbi:MAG: hypothetical protein R6V04_16010 [bacterium]
MKKLFKRKKWYQKKLFNKKKILKVIHKFSDDFISFFTQTVNSFSGNLRRRGAIANMKKGDIILARPRTFVLPLVPLIYRLLLRSQYVHSLLYLGRGNIIHTTARYGVKIDKVPRKIYSKSRYTVYRVKDFDPDLQGEQVVKEALKYKNTKLDHAGLITNIPARIMGLKKPLMSFEKNRLWCSKLIYQIYKANHIELVPAKKTGNITSEDLSKSEVLTKI